jgi:hypothetical protein
VAGARIAVLCVLGYSGCTCRELDVFTHTQDSLPLQYAHHSACSKMASMMKANSSNFNVVSCECLLTRAHMHMHVCVHSLSLSPRISPHNDSARRCRVDRLVAPPSTPLHLPHCTSGTRPRLLAACTRQTRVHTRPNKRRIIHRYHAHQCPTTMCRRAQRFSAPLPHAHTHTRARRRAQDQHAAMPLL